MVSIILPVSYILYGYLKHTPKPLDQERDLLQVNPIVMISKTVYVICADTEVRIWNGETTSSFSIVSKQQFYSGTFNMPGFKISV